MAEPLTSARLKLRRAGDHLAEFNGRMRWFRGTDPWPVTRELERDGAEHVYRLEIRGEPPPDLGPIIGDFFHNLRSSLDSIAHDLSLKEAPTLSKKKVGRTSFPIARSKKAFGKIAKSGLKFVSQDAKELIEHLQPYNQLDWDPSWGDPPHDLWDIGQYNNIDKHGFIHPVPAFPFSLMWTRPSEVPEPVQSSVVPLGSRLSNGQELARFVFATPQPNVDMNFHPSIDVTINGQEVASLQLKRQLELVRDKIVPQFERFF